MKKKLHVPIFVYTLLHPIAEINTQIEICANTVAEPKYNFVKWAYKYT